MAGLVMAGSIMVVSQRSTKPMLVCWSHILLLIRTIVRPVVSATAVAAALSFAGVLSGTGVSTQ